MKAFTGSRLGLGPSRPLALRRDGARQRLPHNPPVHPELLGHAADGSYPKAILPSDLFEQFHLPLLSIASPSWLATTG
jgi:hypothetical protein